MNNPEPSTDRTPGHLPQGGGAPSQPAEVREPEAPTVHDLRSQIKSVVRGRQKRKTSMEQIQ